jgi:hypothetical protein
MRLKMQEHTLRLKDKIEEEYSNHLERLLTSKSNKKNEKELLMYKTDFFRQKKEIKELYENSRPLDEIYGVNGWFMSLRRPANFKGTRFGYINVGSKDYPSWKAVRESYPREIVKIRVSKKDPTEEIDSFRRSDYFKSKVKLEIQKESLQELEVVGDSLLRCEIESARIIPGKKVLFKNQLENLNEGDIGTKYETSRDFYKKR